MNSKSLQKPARTATNKKQQNAHIFSWAQERKGKKYTDGDNDEDLKQERPAAGCLCGMQQSKGAFPVFQRVRYPGPAAGSLCCTCLVCLSTCTLRLQEWLLNSSPSRRDGVSLADEARCRRQYCALIWEAGKRLQLCTPSCCLGPWFTGPSSALLLASAAC